MKKCLIVFCLIFVLGIFCFAQEPIYRYEDVEVITDSVTLTRVREFYADYNLSYTYIKADVSDEDIDLSLLKSPKGVDALATVTELANENENTLAALNADFFSSVGGGKGFSLGIEKKDGVLLENPVYPDTMATVAYDGYSLLMGHIGFGINITSPNGNTHAVRHLNKHTEYYGDILMYTSLFNGGYSPAPGGEVVEVVVSDGKIVEFRRNQPCVKIPEDGCVLVVSEGMNMFLANNFNVGDKIEFDYHISPDFDDYMTAFGGGSMLVFEGKDVGKIGDYTHTVAGFNPRSAIGVTKDGETMYLVAVDGRQKGSRGMRMSHLAELLIDLGCYYGVNLDGGGSTAMVASTLWQNSLHTVNNPTENRKVINAVGITYVGDESEPAGIELKTQRSDIFTGQSINIDLVVYDENKRKVDIDKNDIEWYCDFGDIVDGVYTAEGGGKVLISATYDDLYADITINVIDTVSAIVTNKPVHLEVGDSENIEISVFDYSGVFSQIYDFYDFDIESSDEDVAYIADGKIYAKSEGTATVSVSLGNITSYISVTVGSTPVDFKLDFETELCSIYVYPDDTKGNYRETDEDSYTGARSGKIYFDFTKPKAESDDDDKDSIISIEETEKQQDIERAVYANLNTKIGIDNSCEEISLMFYTQNDFNHKLCAEIIDDEGKVHRIEFVGEIKNAKWCELRAEIPEEITRPIVLSSILVAYTPGEKNDYASIFFDDVTFISYKPYTKELPKHFTYRRDGVNTDVEGSLRIGTLSMDDAILPIGAVGDQKLRQYVGAGELLGTGEGHSVSEDEFAVYIRVDASKGGLRSTNIKQWENIVYMAENASQDYLFILSDSDIFGDDDFENEVIIDYLPSCGKEVMVISSSDYCSLKKLHGITFITLDSTQRSSLLHDASLPQNAVEFYFGDVLTFEFKAI